MSGLNFGQNMFPRRSEYIRTFNLSDMLSGRAYGNFYLGTAGDSTATKKKIMFSTSFDSIDTSIGNVASGHITTATKVGDDDYDLDVGLAQTIKGNALVEMTWNLQLTAPSSPSTTLTGYIIVKLRKWDGSTETEIGSAKTQTITDSNSAGTYNNISRQALKIVCTETEVAEGDTLRLTVESWVTSYVKSGGAPSTSSDILHYIDPYLRVGTSVNYNKPAAGGELYEYKRRTDFKISVPFKVDI